MPVASVGPVKLPDVQMESWLIKFNKEGECTSPQTRQALVERLGQAGDTPVIFFSHGWNNDFDDATELYRQFLLRLQDHIVATNPAMERPMFVGVLWPSIWLSFDSGLAIGGGAEIGAQGDSPLTATEQKVAGELAANLLSAPERERFSALMAVQGLDAAEVSELSTLMQRSLKCSTLGPPAASEEGDPPSAADIESALNALPTRYSHASDDEGKLAPGGIIGSATAVRARPAGLLSYFDPRNALRVASVYQMKDRAGAVGSRGVAALLSDVLDSAPGRVHLVGHSYGCKVVLSALAAAASVRKVSSALLLQPAISHLAFAPWVPTTNGPGGYAGTVARIERSLLMTYSAKDIALHELFHLALRREGDVAEARIAAGGAGEPPSQYAALGGYGPRRAGQQLQDRLPEPGRPFDLLREPTPMAFDGSAGQINGHGDVATPYTAWLMYLQLRK